MRSESGWVNNVATLTLTACAIVVAFTVVRRSAAPLGRSSQPADRLVADWSEMKSVGRRIGAASAPVTIVEFADFECPACRAFALKTLQALRNQRGEQVTVLFRHWPLEYHRFAMSAATAAECAAAQGRFVEMHDLLYEKQDSLGFKNYGEFAREAGVSELNTFADCMKALTTRIPIDRDVRAAVAANAAGTPTIIVNGVMLGGVPDSVVLIKMIDSIAAKYAAPRGPE